MATPPRQTLAPQLEIRVHRRSSDTPATGRLSLADPAESGVAVAMRGGAQSRLLVGLRSGIRVGTG